jgi:heme exporter protein A
MSLVAFSRISVHASRLLILDDVDFSVEEGEVVGVAGPNGAGKTTLLHTVATLQPISGGSGMVLDAALGTGGTRGVRRFIGLSGHDPGLYPELTLTENIRLFARLFGQPLDAADDVLAQVGLEGAGGRRADRSSNGMQRRVDLARLLLLRPRLLLLDEAHAGLDEEAEVLVHELVRRVREEGGGCVMVSHDAARLRDRTDRVVTIREGRVA